MSWDLLKEVLPAAGIGLTPVQFEQLDAYLRLLYEWNARMDLTNVPQQEAPLRHIGDSLLALAQPSLFLPGASAIDVGSGAGLPGLPLAIVRPDLRWTLLDALAKRCDFLNHVVEKLGLKQVQVIHGRAEVAARGPLRARFDAACARAVAPLAVLAEYLLPFVRVGGVMVCWKGPGVAEEARLAAHAVFSLGGAKSRAVPLALPGCDHFLYIAQKTTPTSKVYPRKAGTPAKMPLY